MATANTPGETPVFDELLDCGLCLYSLESPRTLTKCFHSFCKECLDGMDQVVQKGVSGWKCPICTAFSSIDEVLSDSFLEKVLKLKSPIAAMKEPVICQQCYGTVDVKWKCEDCRFQLCKPCQVIHLNIPPLKFHTIIGLDCDSTSCHREVFVDDLVFCKTHTDRIVEVNCKKCETPLCFLCRMKTHNTHETEAVEDALARIVPNVEEQTETISKHIQTIEGQVDKLRKEISDIKQSFTKIKREMRERTNKLIAEFRRMESEEEDKLMKKEEETLMILEKVKSSLEAQLCEMKQLVHVNKYTRKYGKHTTLLQRLQTRLAQRIKEVSQAEPEKMSVWFWCPSFLGGLNDMECAKRQKEIFLRTTFTLSLCNYFSCIA